MEDLDDSHESQAGPSRTEKSKAQDKRATRACLQCRQRKQRCAGPSQIPCTRCADGSRACSFEQDLLSSHVNGLVGTEEALNMPPSSDPVILALQTGLARVLSRVQTLESLLGADMPSTLLSRATAAPSSPSNSYQDHPFHDHHLQPFPLGGRDLDMNSVAVNHSALMTMDFLQNSPPSQGDARTPQAGPSSHNNHVTPPRHARTDPVKLGILSMNEGQQILDIFWENCHPHAPLLCSKTQKHAYALASTSPFLFTACLTVGARYWNLTDKSKQLMHPRYHDIVKTMDQNISQLMLRPDPSDTSLSTIQALLLYIQWTPLEPGPTARSRFGDNAVWLMVGLAGRLAKLLQLERLATSPFTGDLSRVSDEDCAHMRTWLNLTSNDHFIWLVTNFPVTLDATAGVGSARAFAIHPRAQSKDIFAAALAEVVGIADRALRASGKTALSELDAITVRRANEEMREWELAWRIPLAENASVSPASMPLISLRWYQLAINRTHANACLSGQGEPFQMTSLMICVDAAAELLFAVSVEASEAAGLNHRAPRFHKFSVDSTALKALIYTVDYHWVIYAFAAAFLGLAFQRGAIDAELNLVTVHVGGRSPEEANPGSLLSRMLTLGVDLFEQVCAGSSNHPAGQYCEVLRSLVKATTCSSSSTAAQVDVASSTDQDVFQGFDLDFLNQLGLDGFTYTDFRDSIFSFALVPDHS